jgi:RimJ/RimL family protein N-acetyltransferase
VISFHDHDTSIVTDRLTLTALTVEDADEMVSVLDDDRLHEFIGGRPATLDELRDRYRRLVVEPNDPSQVWLNWIVRSRRDGIAVGTMQASLSTGPEGRSVAAVAWVIGVAWQGHGFASEAARSLVAWLRSHGVDEITAHINPDHHASAIVGGRAGLHPSNEQRDGETVWRRVERRWTARVREGAGPKN